MNNKLLKLIKDNDCIAIFRHVRPDGDAMFSALALYHFIKDNFKDKKVKIAGSDKYEIITKIDKISDKYIKDSLAIVLDTSNEARVDDQRFKTAKYIVKIDHHPVTDDYGDLNIVNSAAASCCEVLSDILFSKPFKKYIKSAKVCEYLYCGIITDTINLRTTNVTSNTLYNAYLLAKTGSLQISNLVEKLLDKDLWMFEKISKIRNYLTVNGSFGYICLDKKQLKKLDIGALEAKNNIDEIGKIKDLNVWAFLTQEPDGTYGVSVRSKRGYIINTICQKYGGGGHANASGIKGVKKGEISTLLNELLEVSTKPTKSVKKP